MSKLSSVQIDAIRFYFFSKHDGSIQDTEVSKNEIYEFYNQIVVNGLANFYARSVKILEKNELTVSFENNELPPRYVTLLESANYKRLYELIQHDLSVVNSDFQARALWKEADRQKIQEETRSLLNRW